MYPPWTTPYHRLRQGSQANGTGNLYPLRRQASGYHRKPSGISRIGGVHRQFTVRLTALMRVLVGAYQQDQLLQALWLEQTLQHPDTEFHEPWLVERLRRWHLP